MSTTITPPHRPTGVTHTPAVPPRPRPEGLRRLGIARLARVEFQKMFDTRSGFWLLASIGILAVLASAAVIVLAGDASITFNTMSSAIGVPIAVILPVVALLSVTSEWSQRTGLTTFCLVPHRGRVITAKLLVSLAVGVLAMVVALAVGAVGNVAGAAVHGIDPVWGVTVSDMALVVLANILGMLMGFMFGTVLRSSAAAIVCYFVYAMVLPQLFATLAFFQDWFATIWGWVDFFYATTALYEGAPTGEQWAQLATSGLLWLVVPLAFGLRRVVRAEVT